MATWASYNPEQKSAVQDNIVNPTRSAMILLARLAQLSAAIGAAWNGGLSDLVTGLDNGEVIPNSSGLAGAQGLGKADTINLVGYLINLSDPARSPTAGDGNGGGYNTAFIQALRVKACGVNASLTQ